ncbi:methionyl-tRNA formyltransferase [Ferribacterium limneticum]|uniref:methionyl-tRNA formyltransferase n=1 Tax=Ferribacterium limneticum TaxID=76259 RepID=UPI001CF94B28|nr:methionyl-tRNA formyltransferase [Ferribacterium limneticum]UCV28562.1 methionyl-tRNA formyltransferase [Ferribacterium limneticum]UCV32479.1 methionyl-tRNA formyltransferase [Ferribacterium limneticum]
MRVIFAGTPEFAAQALQAIVEAGHDVALVLTQPDRPAGRGMTLQPSAVKKVALEHGIEVFQPLTLKDAEAQAKVAAVGAEVMIVAAYGLILPQVVLDMPRLGCINIHGSLLPRWRGAAPIQRALLAGDAETGVCIMQMEAGLDTGPVLLRGAFPIAATDTTATLHDRLAELGAKLVVEALGRLPLAAEPQPAEGVTYAHKIEKAEALIDWRKSAAELDRHIRAFNPFPGAQALFRGQTVKLWQATPVAEQGELGTILAVDRHSVVIACGEGALAVTELQKAGGKRLPVQQFLAGHPLTVGDRFDIPA